MKKLVITIIIILLCITGAGVGLYFNMDAHGAFDSASFPKHTSINGVDCSELTVSQAAKELTEEPRLDCHPDHYQKKQDSCRDKI